MQTLGTIDDIRSFAIYPILTYCSSYGCCLKTSGDTLQVFTTIGKDKSLLTFSNIETADYVLQFTNIYNNVLQQIWIL